MDRNEVYEACRGYIWSKDAIDAIIDCAVQEANELVWKQLNDLAERCEAIRKGEVQE